MKRLGLALSAGLVVGLLAPTSGAALAAPAPGTAPADAHVRRAPVSPLVAKALGPAGELRSVAINDVSGGGRAVEAVIPDFPRMAAEGITSVSLYVYLYLPDRAGTTFEAGQNTLTDQEIEAVTQAAHEQGLSVHLTPVLLDKAKTEWRGYYVPSDINAFFTNYTAQLVKYAQLSQRLGHTMFFVGSENDAIANRTAHWRKAVAEVRKHYKGAVTYMSTGYTPLVVKFWDALDLASISVYFSMGEDSNPTYDRFRSAWREVHTPYVASLAKKIRKPMIYAEVGYNSQQHAFAHPERNSGGTNLSAPAAQADGYAALLDVLKDNPSVYGVSWWRWSPTGNAGDTSYAPNRKPAECVLASRWSQDAEIRAAATSDPTCDLHALDAAISTVTGVLPK